MKAAGLSGQLTGGRWIWEGAKMGNYIKIKNKGKIPIVHVKRLVLLWISGKICFLQVRMRYKRRKFI